MALTTRISHTRFSRTTARVQLRTTTTTRKVLSALVKYKFDHGNPHVHPSNANGSNSIKYLHVRVSRLIETPKCAHPHRGQAKCHDTTTTGVGLPFDFLSNVCVCVAPAVVGAVAHGSGNHKAHKAQPLCVGSRCSVVLT